MPLKRVLAVMAISMAMGLMARAEMVTLPAGTQLRVVLDTTVSTKDAQTGDAFRARLVLPVWINGRELLPLGTMIEGTVMKSQGPTRVSGRAELQLRPDKFLLPDGRDIRLGASIESGKMADGSDTKIDPKEGTVKAPGKDGINAKNTAAGAAIGAGVGAVAAGGVGAAIGAGAVGAIAVLHQVFKKGKNAELAAGSELVLELTRGVEVSDMKEVPKKGDAKSSKIPVDDDRPAVMMPSREADQH